MGDHQSKNDPPVGEPNWLLITHRGDKWPKVEGGKF
jgi:hypothetical protein